MSKKLILLKCILFIIMLVFVIFFKSIFGKENTLIGIAVISLALMIIKRKSSEKFIISFLKILSMNIFLGICSFLAPQSLILGMSLNTISMFVVAYVCSYNLDEALYIPFGLQYMFMLHNPVTKEKFFTRLISLVFGALFVVTLQYIKNRKTNCITNKFKENFTRKSLMFSYGIRMALVMAIATFVMNKINLPEGRWIMYTVFSLTRPYKANCNERIPKRLEGTVIGAIIFMILFTLIESSILRILILIIAGYINTYTVEYKKMTICATITALGTVVIGKQLLFITLERILLIIIGTIISKIINNYVLPFNVIDNENRNFKLEN
ncbi:FUSC family protein [Clostridium senegalense]|uniref:FUSC family protein n=1 Tax=Clostridium senegalense TaxID=1465809 RepID=UPI0002890423|nr:FUSC family protein [Clostridium senegalense]